VPLNPLLLPLGTIGTPSSLSTGIKESRDPTVSRPAVCARGRGGAYVTIGAESFAHWQRSGHGRSWVSRRSRICRDGACQVRGLAVFSREAVIIGRGVGIQATSVAVVA